MKTSTPSNSTMYLAIADSLLACYFLLAFFLTLFVQHALVLANFVNHEQAVVSHARLVLTLGFLAVAMLP